MNIENLLSLNTELIEITKQFSDLYTEFGQVKSKNKLNIVNADFLKSGTDLHLWSERIRSEIVHLLQQTAVLEQGNIELTLNMTLLEQSKDMLAADKQAIQLVNDALTKSNTLLTNSNNQLEDQNKALRDYILAAEIGDPIEVNAFLASIENTDIYTVNLKDLPEN